MSHQTGIKSNRELLNIFSNEKQSGGKLRLLKVVINVAQEELQLDSGQTHTVDGDWKNDYRKYVTKSVAVNEPCYLFFRMDSVDESSNNQWVFILYLPSTCSVKNKMLYASTKATLKKDFGTGIIRDYFVDSYGDIHLDQFVKFLASGRASGDDGAKDKDQPLAANYSAGYNNHAMLTAVEQERRKVKMMEHEQSMETNKKNLSNFQFPIHQDAINALLDFRDERVSFVRLQVNIANEEIRLVNKFPVPDSLLSETINVLDESVQTRTLLPRSPVALGDMGFYVFSFKHIDPDQKPAKKHIFLFVLSTESTTIKQRISYSACLQSLYDSITNRISIRIDKRLEVDDASDVTVNLIATKLYPQLDKDPVMNSLENQVNSLKFDKPKPPARGARRIIK